MEDLLAFERIRPLAAAVAKPAHRAESGLLDHFVVIAVFGVLAGEDVDIAVGGHHQVALGADVGARHGQVASGHQHGHVAGEGRGERLFPVAGSNGVRRLRREEPLLLVAGFVVGGSRFHAGHQVDVAPRPHRQLLACRDIGGARVDVLAGDQREISARGNLRADFRAGAQIVPVVLVADDGFAMAFGKRGQGDIAAGLQARIVLDGDLRRGQGQVASGLHAEAAGIHAGYAGNVRTPGRAVVLGSRGGGQRDVAAGRQGDVAALDQRHQVGQVLARCEVDGGALDQAARLVDDVGGGHDGGVARADGSAVGDVAFGGELDATPRHQSAVALQVAFAHQQVDLRRQHGLGGAVGQRDGLLHQPDQVGVEQALLRLGQRDAKLDAVVARELRAGREQGFVLAVVVGVAVQEALAGGGQDLVGDELLFVEAVAQPLGLAGRREESCADGDQGVQAARLLAQARVDEAGSAGIADGRAGMAQLIEQVVAGDAWAIADETRVGGDDVWRIGPAVDGEKLAVRDGGRVGYGADRATAGQADACDEDRAGRVAAAGAGSAAAERDGRIAAGRAHRKLDGLRGERGGVRDGGFLAVA
ncbi:hypothetical protein D9M68_517420 [compost metagenome]